MSSVAPTSPLRLDIDLDFSVEQPGARSVTGHVQAAGAEVVVTLNGDDSVAGMERPTLSSLRAAGNALASQGVTVTVRDDRGEIARLGALPTGPLRRLVGGDRVLSVRLGRALAAVHGRRRGPAEETPVGMPPGTLWPLIPGLTVHPRSKPTRTHGAPGSGRPRLYFVVGSDTWDGSPPLEYNLGETTTIGSSPEADLRLEGLPPIAAVIRHDPDDEYRLDGAIAGGGSAVLDVSGRPRNTGRILRTGARIELGPWRLAYFREEFADHGRPHGGRVGGEGSRQKPQAPRSVGGGGGSASR